MISLCVQYSLRSGALDCPLLLAGFEEKHCNLAQVKIHKVLRLMSHVRACHSDAQNSKFMLGTINDNGDPKLDGECRQHLNCGIMGNILFYRPWKWFSLTSSNFHYILPLNIEHLNSSEGRKDPTMWTDRALMFQVLLLPTNPETCTGLQNCVLSTLSRSIARLGKAKIPTRMGDHTLSQFLKKIIRLLRNRSSRLISRVTNGQGCTWVAARYRVLLLNC